MWTWWSCSARRNSTGLEGADVAVNLHGRGPQSHRVLLAADPWRLISFHHPGVPESAGGPTWRADEHEVRRWCPMLEQHGIPADPTQLRVPPPPISAPGSTRGATLVHPGAASAARRWPPERWAAVARSEAAGGRRVIVTGGPDEAGLARTVARGAGLPDSSVYAGRTGVLELAALVVVAGRVVCGDTGVAHLATALGTPSVVLFGPTSPAAWGPPGLPRHRALWAGCTGDPHARRPDPGLLKIRPEDVTATLSGLPERSPRDGPAGSDSYRTEPLRPHT